MKYQELFLLLPCHSLEDFPLYHTGSEAEGLLSAWSALWHPALLHSAGKLPQWQRADEAMQEFSERLIVVPQVSDSLLPAGWTARAKNEGGVVVRKKFKRAEILAAALDGLDGGDQGISPEAAADFMALGFCYLQVELLIRQMRHYSNMDETHLQTQALAAAAAAVEKDDAKMREHLRQCFDALTESRERCYPAEAYLIDLTLTAEGTLGGSLRAELTAKSAINLMITGELVERMAEQEPESLAALREAAAEGRVCLVGGEFRERDAPLTPMEGLLREFQQGLAAYQTHLNARPKVFGRRRNGLNPAYPMLLSKLDYVGALHFTLDDGVFPKADQSKITWEGFDHSSIPALARVPLDANDPAGMLNFPEKMGESMDLDFVAMIVFAHWPNQGSCFHEDLRRMSQYAPVLGKFVTLEQFFNDVEHAGNISKYAADAYRSPYLKQAVIRRRPDPATTYRRRFEREAALSALQSLQATRAVLQSRPTDAATLASRAEWTAAIEARQSPFDPSPEELAARKTEAEAAGKSWPEGLSEEGLETALADGVRQAAGDLAKAIPRLEKGGGGCFVFNTLSFTRRIAVEGLPLETPPTVEGPVKASQKVGDKAAVVVDVPAMGYVWITAGKPGREASAPMVEDLTLRNEILSVTIDPETGALRSIRDGKHRDNRMSMQLALRTPGPRPAPGSVWRDPDEDAVYSTMKADSVEAGSTGPAFGEIRSRGRLVGDQGQTLAEFEQLARLWRGSRTLELHITLRPQEPPKTDPWNSYYCARFAWNDAGADLFRGVGYCSTDTDAKRLESPYFVEYRTEKYRTAVFTGGLPFHRRQGLRMLDTVLAPRGETESRFRLGVGLDVDHPMLAAVHGMTPATWSADAGPPPKVCPSSWFFHIDARNVFATHWTEWVEQGVVVGFRVRLAEAEGRAVQLKLRSFREPVAARQVDFLGRTLCQLRIEGDSVRVDLSANEWGEVEVRWK